MALIGLYLVAAALLVVAGVAKAARPDDTARALGELLAPWRTVPLRVLRSAVRGGAAVEAGLGLVALLVPRALPAALVSCSYLGFAAVVALARRRGGPLATCGCFGRPDTPPTTVHLLIDLLLAAACGAVAAAAPDHGSVLSELAGQPWDGLPLVFVSAVGTWLTLLALSALGALEGARRLVGGSRPGAAASR